VYKKVCILILVALILMFSESIVRSDVEQPNVWRLQAPWWLITGKTSPSGFREFREAIGKSLEGGSLLGGYSGHSLVERADKHLKSFRQSDIIFLILPKTEEFEALKELREKYPELFPVTSKEFRKFSPLVYLTYDIETERMRGVIIASRVDVCLAEILLEKDLPLNTFFRYEDGKLIEIEGK